jgi:aryl-alcohol dehydrogenase-like predicted oxidoreductase
LILRRDVERDTLPMARMYGLGIAVWSALGSGKLKNEDDVGARPVSLEGR